MTLVPGDMLVWSHKAYVNPRSQVDLVLEVHVRTLEEVMAEHKSGNWIIDLEATARNELNDLPFIITTVCPATGLSARWIPYLPDLLSVCTIIRGSKEPEP